jgi:hypothetical protein
MNGDVYSKKAMAKAVSDYNQKLNGLLTHNSKVEYKLPIKTNKENIKVSGKYSNWFPKLFTTKNK